MTPESPWSNPDVISTFVTGAATLLAAIIVGGFGAYIGGRFSRERDRQDRESQWRSHAVELTKLDLERKLRTRDKDDRKPLRPSILDFLANYRDLQELGESSPSELYEKIKKERISHQEQSGPDTSGADPQTSSGEEDQGG